MDKIRSSKKCTRFIHDFVDVIERDLLVPDVENRKHCEEVVNELKVLQIRCRKDDGYCVQPISHAESLDSKGEQPVVRSPSFSQTFEATTGRTELSPRIMPTPGRREPSTKAEVQFASFSEGSKPTAYEHWLLSRSQTLTTGPSHEQPQSQGSFEPDGDNFLPHISPVPIAEVDPSLPGYLMQSDSGYGTKSLTTTEEEVLLRGLEDGIQSTAADDNDVDTKTNYSNTLSVRMSAKRFGSSIGEMVDDLLVKDLFVHLKNIDHQIVGECTAILPGLLKTLALTIGFEAPSQIHRDVMVFLHKNRE